MDELVTRVRPNSIEAEQSVIGAMILEGSYIDDAAEIISRDDFYYPQYGIVFEAIVELKNEGRNADLVTITDRLKKKGAPPEVCEPGLLSEFAGAVPLAVNIKEYARIVKRKSLLRQIIDKNHEVSELCYKDSGELDEILDLAERNFMALLQKRGINDAVPIAEVVDNAMEMIRTAYQNKGELTGLSTGFIDLDANTAGLQDSDLILIAARPSMGKTAFALNIAGHAAFRQNKAVAIFSLEMPKESLMFRFFSMEAGIDASRIRVGELEDNDWPKLIETADKIAQSSLIIDETPAITISELRSKCRKYKQQHDIKLVVIDYLQLMTTGSRSESRQQEISEISRSLKALARELEVPVVALSQLNRTVEGRDDKRPMLSDLRDSGAIEQDADVVMFLYRDDYYNKESSKKGISEVIIAKQRNGPTATVDLAWLAKYTRFANSDRARNRINEVD